MISRDNFTNMRGITRDKLIQSHPHIAQALDEIFNSSNKKKYYWFFVNYNGKYKTASGIARTVSFGAIIDVLTECGYIIDISLRKTLEP